MIITNIEKQKKNKNRYNIFINNEFAFGLNEDVIVKHSISVGQEITEQYIEDILKSEEKAKAINYAIILLGYRPRSINELKLKMSEKGYESELIDYAIEMLEKYNYLNDYEFGKSFIKDKQSFKKAGKNLLKRELYQKGIDKEIVNQLIIETVNEEDEYERAFALAKKKNDILKSDDINTRYRKLSGLLVRKGYSFDIISKVLNEILKGERGYEY